MDSGQLVQCGSATELGKLIASRELSPVEVVEAYLERIDRYNGQLNAYITVCRDEALAAARRAEQAIASGESLGPLHGLPLAVKDQFLTEGVRTTGASSILADYVPTEDATVMARTKAAGAILLGKLNLTEFAAGGGDHYKHGDPPRNPWDPERTPGISSAGSGIAISASLSAITLGEDTGGSIRGPAAFCGIVGLRPTYGRVSRHGMLPFSWSMDAAGPMTRTVEDAALIMNVLAGYDPKDPQTSHRSVPDYTKALSTDLQGLRVGFMSDYVEGDGVNPEVAAAVRDAVAQIEQLGATVEEVSLPLLFEMGTAYAIISESEAADAHAEWLRTRPGDYGNNIRRRIQAASLMPGQLLHKAMHMRALLRREWLKLFERFDILVNPTAPGPATKIEYVDGVNTREEAQKRFGGRRAPTTPAAFVGAPAMSVPCGATSEGLPIGLHIIGRHFQEETVLRAGYAYQEATSWHRRRPPL